MENNTFEENGENMNNHDAHQGNGIRRLKGFQLFRSRILGLLTKRIICTQRRWILFLLIVSPQIGTWLLLN